MEDTCQRCKRPSRLSCGKCYKSICSNCLLHTPGGIRCRDCSNMKGLIPSLKWTQTLSLLLLIPAVGLALGLMISLFAPNFIGLTVFNLALQGGIGYLIASILTFLINKPTRYKRGNTIQKLCLAYAACVLVGVVGTDLALTSNLKVAIIDILSPAIAALLLWNRFE